MFNLGDVVYFEDDHADDDEAVILSGKVIELNETHGRSGVNTCYLTDADTSWRGEYEIFRNQGNLIKDMLRNAIELKEDIKDNIRELEDDLKDVYKEALQIESKISKIKKLKD